MKVVNVVRLLTFATVLFFLSGSSAIAQKGGSTQEKTEKVAWLGITATEGAGISGKDPELRMVAVKVHIIQKAKGLRVQAVEAGSLAEKLGLKNNDQILHINKKPMDSLSDINSIAGNLQPGDELIFNVLRESRTFEFAGAFENTAENK